MKYISPDIELKKCIVTNTMLVHECRVYKCLLLDVSKKCARRIDTIDYVTYAKIKGKQEVGEARWVLGRWIQG